MSGVFSTSRRLTGSGVLLFVDRSRRAGRYLEWKVRLFSVAAVLVVVGMYLEEAWMTAAAILLLFAALSLRFLPGAVPHGDDAEAESEADDTD